jgi:hypothetical protein
MNHDSQKHLGSVAKQAVNDDIQTVITHAINRAVGT